MAMNNIAQTKRLGRPKYKLQNGFVLFGRPIRVGCAHFVPASGHIFCVRVSVVTGDDRRLDKTHTQDYKCMLPDEYIKNLEIIKIYTFSLVVQPPLASVASFGFIFRRLLAIHHFHHLFGGHRNGLRMKKDRMNKIYEPKICLQCVNDVCTLARAFIYDMNGIPSIRQMGEQRRDRARGCTEMNHINCDKIHLNCHKYLIKFRWCVTTANEQ